MGGSEGIYVVQSLRLVVEDARSNKELVRSVRGTPWQPSVQSSGDESRDLPQPITAEPERPEVIPADPHAFRREPMVRRVYITRRTFEQFGHLAGRPACEATRQGNRGTGVFLTHEWRARIENSTENDPIEAERKARAD